MGDTDDLVTRLLSRVAGCRPSRDNTQPRPEIASIGIDEFLQGVGGDAFGSLSTTGLRVPALVPESGARYLFSLASLTVSTGERVRIKGLRQLLEIGLTQAQEDASPYPVVLPVTTPNWKFVDGNVSWHLQRVPFRSRPKLDVRNSNNFIFRNAFPGGSGALLYETFTAPAADVNSQGRPDFYTTINSYTPPNAGRPYGVPLLPVIHDLRFPWREVHSSDTLNLLVDGPCYVVFFASVLQTSSGRHLTLPNGATASDLVDMPEEAFLVNFSTTNTPVGYWRVAGMIDAEWVR